MSFKIVESWYEDKLVSHTRIQMMQYSLYIVRDSNRFPQSLQMEKLWDCEDQTQHKSFQLQPVQARFWEWLNVEYNLLSSFHVIPELL